MVTANQQLRHRPDCTRIWHCSSDRRTIAAAQENGPIYRQTKWPAFLPRRQGQSRRGLARIAGRCGGEASGALSSISDSLNDLPLLARVSDPIAVDPDETLRRHAEKLGWPVISLR